MVFNYIFSVKDYNADFLNFSNESPIEYILPIDPEILGSNPLLFKQLHNTDHRFCFSIGTELTRQNSEFIKKEVTQNLVRLLFLPNYIKLSGAYLFFVESEKGYPEKMEYLKTEITKELKKQGIEKIIFESICNDNSFDNLQNEELVAVKHSFLNNYLEDGNKLFDLENSIKSFYITQYFKTRFIISASTPDKLQNIIKLLHHFEDLLRHFEPEKVKLIEMFKKAEIENNHFRMDNYLLKDKLENSTTYLTELKKNAQWYIQDHSRLTLEVQGMSQMNFNTLNHLPPSFDNHAYILQLQTQIISEQNHSKEIICV